MDFLIGTGLALTISLLAHIVGFDRDRSFYPVVMMVIASYYGLFAIMGDALSALVPEIIAMTAFTLAAIVGFKKNLWIVAIALAAHGVFDFFHAALIHNPGVPAWWPAFCGAYDIVAAACLAVLLIRKQPPAKA